MSKRSVLSTDKPSEKTTRKFCLLEAAEIKSPFRIQ